MKPATMKVTTDDRFATYEEVRSAIASTEDRVFELCHAEGSYCQMNSDIGGIIRYPAEEFEFFAYLGDMDENLTN